MTRRVAVATRHCRCHLIMSAVTFTSDDIFHGDGILHSFDIQSDIHWQQLLDLSVIFFLGNSPIPVCLAIDILFYLY